MRSRVACGVRSLFGILILLTELKSWPIIKTFQKRVDIYFHLLSVPKGKVHSARAVGLAPGLLPLAQAGKRFRTDGEFFQMHGHVGDAIPVRSSKDLLDQI